MLERDYRGGGMPSAYYSHLFGRLLQAALGWLLCSTVAAAELQVTLTSPQTGLDPRTSYNGLVLALALDKTRAEYGDYRLEITPFMNTARAIQETRKGRFPNQILMTSFQNRLLAEGLDYARFPVDYGVTGYRICFVSPQASAAVGKAGNLGELRKFTIGQGTGWADSEILRFNGFTVYEAGQQESLFLMVAAGRFDLFCRGINELEPELNRYKQDIGALEYDRSMALSYPLPRFFFASKHNRALLERITRGLQIAHQDGSLRKLWLAQFGSALRFANLKQRRIFELKTPNIDLIDFDYRKYYFDPTR